ncbi:integrase, catalytic region, zinc finger, CCHC-type containing protein [Tanacetum coccineum]
MDVAFIQALLKEQNARNRPNGNFSPHAYTNIVKALSDKFNITFEKEKLKNQIKTLKKYFNQFHDVFLGVLLSGYAWNPSTRLIVAKDDVWEALKKDKPNVYKLKTKQVNCYDEMYALWAKDRAIDNINTVDDIHVTSLTPQSVGKLPTKSKSKKKVDEEDPYQDKISNSFDNILHALDMNSKVSYLQGASERPPMLEKGSYIPWASRFMRFLENKQEDRERMRQSIEVGPYVRQLIPDPDKPDQSHATIIKTVSKMSEINKKQYYADIRIHSRLVDEFDKFVSTEEESLSSVYERLITLVNVMDRNQIPDYDQLFDTLSQFEPHVIAKRAKQSARNHDLLALVAHSNVHNSQSHATPSYSHSPQLYYVTHPTSVIDHDEDYQGEIQGDAQEDKLITVMMLLARAITQHYSTPTNNRNRMVHQMEANDQTIQQASRTESNLGKPNVQCYNCNARVIMMIRIQPTDDTSATSSRSDANILSEVNASTKHNKSRMPSKSVHEYKNHAKLKTVINTYDDDQIDSSVIFDDPYMEDNELETFKERVKTLEKQPVKALNYKDAYEELEREICADKDKIDNRIKEKAKLHDKCVQQEYATLKYRNETELSKRLLKNEKIVILKRLLILQNNSGLMIKFLFKIGQSIQTICIPAKKPNKVYDPFLKDGLGYQNPERLKKSIKAQTKMYNGDNLHSTKLKIDSPDYEETLENEEESRLKMKDKMIQLDYEKLNALYKTFVPKTEFPIEQTYLSSASTSNVSSESSEEMSDLLVKKMPNESKLLNLFEKLEKTIGQLQIGIDETLLKDRSRAIILDDQDELRQFYKTGVIPMSITLRRCLNEIKQEIKEEVKDMFDIF